MLLAENDMAGHKDETAADRDVIFGSMQCDLSGSMTGRG